MKKLLSAIMLMALSLCLFACGSGDDTDGGDTGDGNGGSSGISLISSGEIVYSIVRPDVADENTVKAAIRLRKALSEATGIEILLTTDWDEREVTPAEISERREILIGSTNREESARALEAVEDPNGYIVTVDGNKLVIAAKNSATLSDAVDALLAELLQVDEEGNYTPVTEVTIMSDLKLSGLRSTEKTVTVLMSDANYSEALLEKLGASGVKLKTASRDDAPEDVFDIDETDLVVLCGAETVPYGTLTAAAEYLKDGGRLLTLGGPPFAETLYKSNGEWQTRREYINSLADSASLTPLIDTTNSRIIRRFTRSSNDLNTKKTITLEEGAREGEKSPAIKVEIETFTNWDLFGYSMEMPQGANAFSFWAKGSELATSLYIEVSENDGSRWYATPKLTTEWQYNLLTAADFKFWEGTNRGGVDDKLNIANVRSISFGFALSGQPELVSTGHTFMLSDVCSTTYQPGGVELEATPVIVGLSPQYKFYQITNAATVTAHSNQIFVADTAYKIDADMYSVAPARQGTGFDNGRQNRFIPLLEVYDEKGLRSGFAAWMYIFESAGSLSNPCPGAILASFGAGDGGFYDEAGLQAVVDTAKAMMSDSFLIEGGTEDYIYIEDETDTITLGAIASSVNPASGEEVRVTLYNGDTELHVFTSELAGAAVLTTVGKSALYRFEDSYSFGEKPDRAVTELFIGGELFDRIEHEISFWSPSTDKGFVYYENGSFMRDGEPINLYGINYMPSSGMATEAGELFEYYVSSASYDPDVFYNDLLHVKDLGFNAVSLFGYAGTTSETNNMLHLVEMCGDLGLLVDLSIRPAYPFYYNEEEIALQLTKLHFYENTNIVAYDIAWESTIGKYEAGSITAGGHLRQDLDDDWREWINVQYGSLENAEAAWGVRAPRKNGEVVGVQDSMLCESEGSRNSALVAAYRRFIDDAVAAEFRKAVDHIKSIAPNQLVSFRMQTAGTPSSDPAEYHYDYQSLASSLDFMSPEGYALSSAAGNTRQGIFANLYARYVKPDSPTVWKEFGYSIWNGSSFDMSETKLEYQAEFYRDIYEMCLEGYTAATYCWYYTPGYRHGETSDYGVLNPDGSDRPVTAVIREYSEKFKNIGELAEPDYYISIDRDKHPDGIRGIYSEIKEELESALDAGHTVAFTNDGIGKNIADVIDIAVGDAPAESGSYPRKYANGTITGVYVTDSNGTRTRVLDNDTISVSGACSIELVVTNTAYAMWADGQVSLVSTQSPGLTDEVGVNVPVPALDYLGEAKLTFTIPDTKGAYSLRLGAEGVLFANDFSFTVQ